jgi:thiol:disulfide interchange protein
MRTRHLIVLFILSLFSAGSAVGQIDNGPEWSYKFSKKEVKVGEEVELILTAVPKNGWYIVSTKVYCEVGGPNKTSLTFDKHNSFELVGELYSVGDKEYHDDVFNCKYFKFYKKAELRQKIKVLSADLELKGFLEGQTCSDLSGVCVFFEWPDMEFSGLKVKGGSTKPDNTPKDDPPKEDDPDDIPEVTPVDTAGSVDTLGVDSADTNQTEKINYTPSYRKSGPNDTDPCIPKTFSGAEGQTDGTENNWTLFIVAFISGLAALLTPCVFPMIPMTVSFFMKDKKKKGGAVKDGLIYGLSIILIYTIIGTVVAVAFGAEFANLLATHWLPNILFFVVFVIFAASFFGAFEIVLPSWMVNKIDQKADKGGLIGTFFMAFTIVLVSFSCTGPIVGSILVESVQGAFIRPIIGMLGFSLAFALPFGLFAVFPQWLNSLPKSGGWLNSVKVILGFAELALGLKFLSIADQTYHWGLLDREVYLSIWIVIFTLMGIYLMGKIKFAHDSDLPFIKVPRLFMVIITFSFVIYMIPGLWGAPLKFLSGYLPPMSTQDFNIEKSIREASGIPDELCFKPKYSDELHIAHGLHGYFDYDEGVACAKELGKPVFLDFTGHGCVNCRKMEEFVWADPKVLKLLKEEFVIVSLYVDDKVIELPKEDVYTSRFNGREITMLGRKNADIQKCYFNTQSQPWYIVLDGADESMCSPGRGSNYKDGENFDAKEFAEYLEEALAEFKKRNPDNQKKDKK